MQEDFQICISVSFIIKTFDLLNTILLTRTKALVNNLLMSNLQWKSKLDNKSRTIEIVILNTKWKDCKSRKNLCTKNFTYTRKFYVHEITAVSLSKVYFLKNSKETCKPSNCDLNRDWNNKFSQSIIRSSHRKCSIKKLFLKIS